MLLDPNNKYVLVFLGTGYLPYFSNCGKAEYSPLNVSSVIHINDRVINLLIDISSELAVFILPNILLQE